MSFSSRLKATAQRLLEKYGQELTISRDAYSYYDPEVGEPVLSTHTTYTGVGNPSQYINEELIENEVLSTDIKLYFYSDTDPLVGDIVSLDDSDMRVLNVSKERAQGTTCLYILQLRIG